MNINELKHNVTAIPGSDGRALMIRDDSHLSVAFTAEAIRLRDEALAPLRAITGVQNDRDQAEAVAAIMPGKALEKEAEADRKDTKEPVLRFGKLIDSQAKLFLEPLVAERERVEALLRDYVNVVEANRRAAEALHTKHLLEREREKQEQLAKATTVDEIDQIQAAACEAIRNSKPGLVVERAEGQVVSQDWKIEITDIWALAKAAPHCVHIQPRLVEIKNMLKAGTCPAGVKAHRVYNTTVRTQPRREPLQIA